MERREGDGMWRGEERGEEGRRREGKSSDVRGRKRRGKGSGGERGEEG